MCGKYVYHGAYIPDFNVTANDQAYNIEVKGFWDDRSIKKTASARTQEESEGEVIIIDSDLYGLLRSIRYYFTKIA
ncbi:hypothetical protein PASE110613_12525 [Paenibacillus sediminis]|uniref:Nuclease of restriction endonuclease-like RecB superfamily n=1 Tax=Paenibacillus sediminis TaxID=664909 RepID=A0ABS4H545_9BACL|nr:hypothetical protein [Paenibacillus sediminis]MBP1937649.1 putative nuclease of restriction endonuclease-like RecB superfamily [Paenibacillus sediminis]